MTDIIWQSNEAEEALGVKSSGAWSASGISIDTRTIQDGDLFVAIRGESNDGHLYLNEAAEKGAVALLVDNFPVDYVGAAPTIIVSDPLAALVRLAKYRRAQTSAKIIGITGSVGKTSVKEGASTVLSDFGKVHTTIGNLNNHIGLPLSLARMSKDCDFGVFELGMSGKGEISYLSKILCPDIAVITNIRGMHLEFFDSIEGIAHAKSEIFEGLKNEGVALLPRDDKFFDILQENASKNSSIITKSFGLTSDSNILYNIESISSYGQDISVFCNDDIFKYSLPAFGDHQALNSAIVFAICDAAEVDLKKAAEYIGRIEPIKGRGKITKANYAGKKFTLIDDSYNAGPDSMRAAFDVLSEVKKQNGGRAIALLGDMLELGDDSQELHEGLSSSIEVANIDMTYTSGENMGNLTQSLPDNISGGNFETPEAILPEFENYVADGDVVLVKGSNGSKMWRLVDIICQ